jgi:hypothetical protein
MKRCVILYVVLMSFCALGGAQEIKIKIKEIYRRTITSDYTRYEYVFSVTNHTTERLNLFIDVSLLDSGKNILETRFLNFETPEGATETGSIESDYPPTVSATSGTTASFYKLSIRDPALNKVYEQGGDLNVKVIHRQG